MNNALLFAIPTLIWGSTWLAIRYQLGEVDPLVSVAYRFVAAGALLLAFCRIRGISLRLSVRDQVFVGLQGLLLFGVNYWLVYEAERFLPSGLVATVFTGILFANVLNGRLFLGSPVRRPVVAGGALGLAGVSAIFLNDLRAFSVSSRNLQSLSLAVVSVYLASLGNILSARNQRAGLSVLQTNTLGMLYGGTAMAVFSALLGKPFSFDTSLPYIASLTYLTVFGSIVAFACFLTLLGRIGADKAAYVPLVMPVIALILTTLFEGYHWTPAALAGAVLVLVGNYVALRR